MRYLQMINFSEELKLMRNLGFVASKRFVHENLYWNYRLGGLQSALGISQLKNLNKTIDIKIKQGIFIKNYSKNIPIY